jgi:DNA-binding SARP family transcriptional activator
MLNKNGTSNDKGKPEIPASLLQPLPPLALSPKEDLLLYPPLCPQQGELKGLSVANNGKSRGHDDKKNSPDVESLSIWPRMAHLLKAEQYDRAAELLMKANLAKQFSGSETNLAFLVMAREIYLTYHQYQAEITHHQQALEAANRSARELSQQLYTMFTQPGEQLRSGKGDKGPASWTISSQSRSDQKQAGPGLASLKICCLGTFQVCLNGQLISDWNSLKARSIFKYLAMHPDTPTPSEILMDVFWPDADPEGARHNLHQAIHSLRKTLKQGGTIQPVLFEHDGYFLNPELNLWLDNIEFEKQVQWGRRLEKSGCLAEALGVYRSAAELYRGDLLFEDRYEDWSALPHREYLRQLYIDLMDQLSETALQQGDLAETIAFCQKILAQDNCHEATHRRLMRCYLLQGQRYLAIRQYLFCVHNLKAELDVSPSAATQLLYEQILGAQ